MLNLSEKIKFKPMTKAQIVISLDRLTRFKPTEEKYLRVFRDILISNLISPKFNKKQLELMDNSELKALAEEIFNFSLTLFGFKLSKDFTINAKLLEYEKSIFKLNEDTQKLLKNKLDYKSAIKLLEGEDEDKNLPLNLKWLNFLDYEGSQIENRKNLGLGFPLEKIVITEGITEEILLPKFAKLCGCDFEKMGIKLLSAGGKNQVVKLFYQLVDNLKLPIFVLLDKDAEENLAEISPKLRKMDKVHIFSSGEFEDVLPLSLIKRTLNNHLKNFASVNLAELQQDLPMTRILEEIFKQKGFNEFKKAEFASLVAENIKSNEDVSPEIATAINELNLL